MEEEKPKKEKEATSFSLSNPSRVTPPQGRFISLQPTQRYVPVSMVHMTGGTISFSYFIAAKMLLILCCSAYSASSLYVMPLYSPHLFTPFTMSPLIPLHSHSFLSFSPPLYPLLLFSLISSTIRYDMT